MFLPLAQSNFVCEYLYWKMPTCAMEIRKYTNIFSFEIWNFCVSYWGNLVTIYLILVGTKLEVQSILEIKHYWVSVYGWKQDSGKLKSLWSFGTFHHLTGLVLFSRCRRFLQNWITHTWICLVAYSAFSHLCPIDLKLDLKW